MVSNKYILIGKKQHWIYNGGCEFEWHFHKGKVEWHHPISSQPHIGMHLCEAHHSLLQGRKKLYDGESENMTLTEIKELLVDQENRIIKKAGFSPKDKDKH